MPALELDPARLGPTNPHGPETARLPGWITGLSRGPRRFVRAVFDAGRGFADQDGSMVAGHLAFTGILCLFPFFALLMLLAGQIGQTATARQTIDVALGLTPPEVRSALAPAVDQVRKGLRPTILGFGILATVWVASSGLEAARMALNRAYGPGHRQRGWLYLRLRSILLTAVMAIALLACAAVMAAGPLLDLLAWLHERRLYDRSFAPPLRYGISLVIVTCLLLLLHRVLPHARLRTAEVLPGVLLTVLVHVGMAALYSTYLRRVAAYNVTYGSLGGVVLTLVFFYVSAAIFIFGAQLNAALRSSSTTHGMAGEARFGLPPIAPGAR